MRCFKGLSTSEVRPCLVKDTATNNFGEDRVTRFVFKGTGAIQIFGWLVIYGQKTWEFTDKAVDDGID